MALMFEKTVRLFGLCPQMAAALPVIAGCYDRFQVDCVVTTGSEGQHGEASLHYVGMALDFRTRTLAEVDRPKLRDLIASRLGPDFDVVLEATHAHVEWQPKWIGSSTATAVA